jgi:NAD(P)-dependent dehydrogenase (short-subunit alcohol dehydrogenase family)
MTGPLHGRVAIVTGGSRRRAIGAAIARRLVGDQAEWITGQTIASDGGWSALSGI